MQTRPMNVLESVSALTLRKEGAPIPLKPLKKWDNDQDVVLAGDAAGVVAPSSGEGIYYAMCSGRQAAHAVAETLRTHNAKNLRLARKHFVKQHGTVFRGCPQSRGRLLAGDFSSAVSRRVAATSFCG